MSFSMVLTFTLNHLNCMACGGGVRWSSHFASCTHWEVFPSDRCSGYFSLTDTVNSCNVGSSGHPSANLKARITSKKARNYTLTLMKSHTQDFHSDHKDVSVRGLKWKCFQWVKLTVLAPGQKSFRLFSHSWCLKPHAALFMDLVNFVHEGKPFSSTCTWSLHTNQGVRGHKATVQPQPLIWLCHEISGPQNIWLV